MPMLDFPTRYRPRDPNRYVSPAVLTPPDENVSPAFDPSAIQTQSLQDSPPQSPPPDEIPAPPRLNDTSAAASLSNVAPPNPDVASKSSMPGVRSGGIMPPPGMAPPAPPPGEAPPDLGPAAAPPAIPDATPKPVKPKSLAPEPDAVEADAQLGAAVKARAAAEATKPEAPKSNLAQRIGMAVLSMTRLAPAANQIIHPKWTEEEAAYERNVGAADKQLKSAETAMGAQSLKEQREANAAYKDAQAAQTEVYKHQNDPHFGMTQIDPDQAKDYVPWMKPDEKGEYWISSAVANTLSKPDKEAKPIVVPEGSSVVDTSGKVIYKGAPKAEKPQNVTNEYEGILREFTGPDGQPDYAKANAEYNRRQTQRTLATRAPKEPSETKERSRAINAAFAASGNNWNTVLDNVRAGKFPDYAAEIADHAQKMTQLPTDTQRKVAAADTTIQQVQEAIDAIDEIAKNHPDMIGGVGTGNIVGAAKRKFQTTMGTEPPDIGAVDSILETTAALQPGQHNFRSVGALAEFKKALGIDPRTGKADGSRAWLVNPEKAKAALKSVAEFNQRLRDNTLGVTGKQQPDAKAKDPLGIR